MAQAQVVTAADLAITKTAPATASVGDNILYTITLANLGTADAQNVAVSDILPPGTTFVSFSAPAGYTSTTPAVGGTGTVTATIATLASGAASTFALFVNAAAGSAGSTLTNTATVTSATNDANPANNSATATTQVQGADLALSKTAPAAAPEGGNITYTITLTNAGPAAAQNAAVSDTLPPGTTFVSFSAPAGFTSTTPAVGGTGTVTATTATLASATTSTFTLVVNTAAGSGGSTLTNTATATSATSDPNPANNSATATTQVQGANLALTKTAPATAQEGGNITYTITLSNAGPAAAQSVAVTDVLPAGTTFVSFGAPAGFTSTTPAVGGTGTVTATTATLASATTATFTLIVNTAAVMAGATVTNTVTVTATSADEMPGNNTATATTAIKKDLGVACMNDSECVLGHCVDSVCCDTACGGGDTNDCQACSVARGAAANGTCGSRPNGASCSDQNPCTFSDVCTTGVCGGRDVVCPPPDACHAPGSCIPSSGQCSYPVKLNGTPCDDGNICTVSDSCMAGVCQATARSCDDGDSCTVDTCAPVVGCTHATIPMCQVPDAGADAAVDGSADAGPEDSGNVGIDATSPALDAEQSGIPDAGPDVSLGTPPDATVQVDAAIGQPTADAAAGTDVRSAADTAPPGMVGRADAAPDALTAQDVGIDRTSSDAVVAADARAAADLAPGVAGDAATQSRPDGAAQDARDGATDARKSSQGSSGCNCRVGSSSSNHLLQSLLLLAAGVYLRLRRRRRCQVARSRAPEALP